MQLYCKNNRPMKNKKHIALGLLLVAGVWTGCKKDEDPDATRPQINSATANGEASALTVTAGSTLQFSINAYDDRELKQVKIDIHDSFDGHEHRNTPFSSQTIYTVSGTSASISPTVNIPSTAASGPYHIEIYCIDASGNEALNYEIELEITQVGQPVLNVSSPDLSGELDHVPGDTIFITGNITDDIDLEEVWIKLENEDTGAELYNETFDLSASTVTTWNFTELATQNKYIIIPAGAALGHHGLVIRAKDSDGNVLFVETHVHVD